MLPLPYNLTSWKEFPTLENPLKVSFVSTSWKWKSDVHKKGCSEEREDQGVGFIQPRRPGIQIAQDAARLELAVCALQIRGSLIALVIRLQILHARHVGLSRTHPGTRQSRMHYCSELRTKTQESVQEWAQLVNPGTQFSQGPNWERVYRSIVLQHLTHHSMRLKSPKRGFADPFGSYRQGKGRRWVASEKFLRGWVARCAGKAKAWRASSATMAQRLRPTCVAASSSPSDDASCALSAANYRGVWSAEYAKSVSILHNTSIA